MAFCPFSHVWSPDKGMSDFVVFFVPGDDVYSLLFLEV